MKRVFQMVVIIVSLVASTVVLASSGVEVEMKGEIVDLHCHLSSGATGPEHSDCAAACISRGVPAVLRAENGTLYVLLDTKGVSVAEKISGWIGKPVTVRGVEIEKDGLRAIRVSEVTE